MQTIQQEKIFNVESNTSERTVHPKKRKTTVHRSNGDVTIQPFLQNYWMAKI
jgi:hypothetical protein